MNGSTDVLSAVTRAVLQRIQQEQGLVVIKGEPYTLARPVVFDVASVLGVGPDVVTQAIEAGAGNGVLRITRSEETGEIVAVRADPL
jgi:hypothetical protein